MNMTIVSYDHKCTLHYKMIITDLLLALASVINHKWRAKLWHDLLYLSDNSRGVICNSAMFKVQPTG